MDEYLDPSDEQDFASWLRALETAVDDLEGAAIAQMKPLAARKLGRVSAAAIVAESAEKIAKLIALARRSTGYGGDPSGNGGSNDAN